METSPYHRNPAEAHGSYPYHDVLKFEEVLGEAMLAGEDCRNRLFTSQQEVIDYLSSLFIPFDEPLPPIDIVARGDDIQVPALRTQMVEINKKITPVLFSEDRPLDITESIRCTPLRLDAIYSTKEADSELSPYAARIICVAEANDPTIIMPNRVQLIPKREVIIPLHQQTQIEVVATDVVLSEQHQTGKILSKAFAYGDTAQDDMTPRLQKIEKDACNSSTNFTRLQSLQSLKDIAHYGRDLLETQNPLKYSHLVALSDFYRAHLPSLIDRRCHLVFSGDVMVAKVTNKASSSWNTVETAQQELQAIIKDIIVPQQAEHAVAFYRNSPCLLLEGFTSENVLHRTLVPIENILRLNIRAQQAHNL